MKCLNCGMDYQGNFCPNCGASDLENKWGDPSGLPEEVISEGQQRKQKGNAGGPQPGNFGGPQPGSFGGPQQGNFGGPQPGNIGGPQPGNFGGPQPGNIGGPQPGNFGGPQPGNFGGPQQGNYGGQGPASCPGGAAARGIVRRSVGSCILLTIVTCGIYGLFWLCMLNEDTARISGEPQICSGGMLILLSIVTCGIYGIYWCYKTGEMLERVRAYRNEPPGSFPLLFLILSLVGLSIVNYALMQEEINKCAAL